MDALESVMFSVAALEGFVNEATELATYPVPPGSGETPSAVVSFAAILKEADESKAQLGLKFQLARLALIGETYDTSQLPYQDFALLIRLRNSLTHYRNQETFSLDQENILTVSPPKILDQLQAKNITAVFDGEKEVKGRVLTTWINRITTVAVARWSCQTASAMVYSILDGLPDCYFRDQAERFYRAPFKASL